MPQWKHDFHCDFVQTHKRIVISLCVWTYKVHSRIVILLFVGTNAQWKHDSVMHYVHIYNKIVILLYILSNKLTILSCLDKIHNRIVSLLNLRVVPKGMSHYQLLQQALQVLHEGLAVECNSNIQRPRKRLPTRRVAKAVDHGIEHLLLLLSIYIWM